MLGFVVMIVGIVAKISEGKYILMSTDNTDEEISSITTMLIVIGLFICIVGAFGAVGALFAGTTGGRGILLLVRRRCWYIVSMVYCICNHFSALYSIQSL